MSPGVRAALPSESLPTAQKAVSDGANRDHKSGYTLANRVRQKRWSHRRRATNSPIPAFDYFAVDFGKADEISVSFLSDMHAAHAIYELQAYTMSYGALRSAAVLRTGRGGSGTLWPQCYSMPYNEEGEEKNKGG